MLTDRIDAELLDAAPHLRAIANYAVGYDNIDLEATRARGIPVGNTPDVLTDATADLAIALMLAVARRIDESAADVRAGTWETWEPDRWLGARRARRDARHRRLRAASGRPWPGARRGLRHDRPPHSRDDAPGGAARARGLRLAARAAHARDPPPDRRRGARAHEADRDPRQHGARPRSSTTTRSSLRCTRARSPAPASTSPTPSRCPPVDPLLRRAEPARRAAHRLGHPRAPASGWPTWPSTTCSPPSTAGRCRTRV